MDDFEAKKEDDFEKKNTKNVKKYKNPDLLPFKSTNICSYSYIRYPQLCLAIVSAPSVGMLIDLTYDRIMELLFILFHKKIISFLSRFYQQNLLGNPQICPRMSKVWMQENPNRIIFKCVAASCEGVPIL